MTTFVAPIQALVHSCAVGLDRILYITTMADWSIHSIDPVTKGTDFATMQYRPDGLFCFHVLCLMTVAHCNSGKHVCREPKLGLSGWKTRPAEPTKRHGI